MTPIPPKLKTEILADPKYKTCMLYGQKDHYCDGRITFEHALTFAGRQVQEKFAILSICARGHEVDQYQDAHTMVKEKNVWVALNRALDGELQALSKAEDYTRTRDRLNRKYGSWQQQFPTDPYFHEKMEKIHSDKLKSPFKTMWYPVSGKNAKVLEDIQKFYDSLGSTKSIFEIIDHLIENEQEVMERYQKSKEQTKNL